MKFNLKLIGACALVGAFAATPASAEWTQYGENGMKTTNLGGAGVASADDIDVWNTNPAGSTKFATPRVGVSIKALNTTNVKNSEPGFNHGVKDTVAGSEFAYLPSIAAYAPGLIPNVTLGVGFGAVSALAAIWGNSNGLNINPGAVNGGQNNQGFQKVEALVAETSPTIGIKLSDKLSVGATLGITTVKHAMFDVSLAGVGSLRAQTGEDIGLPIPPWEFATSPSEFSYTLGVQYQLLPTVAIGGVFRSEAPTEYDLHLKLNTVALAGAPTNNTFEQARATMKLEVPRHVQLGVSVDVLPTLKVHADVKWTNWGSATGIGSNLVVQIAQNPSNLILGNFNGGARQLVASNSGNDTYALRVGAQWRVLPNLELQAGYHYDPAVFDKVDLNYFNYSTDRNIYSLGASLDVPDSALLGSNGEWEFTVGGQLIQYEDITVQPGQSQSFGLTGASLGGLGAGGTVQFAPNNQAFTLGGYIWSAGVQAVYKFGAPEEVALK